MQEERLFVHKSALANREDTFRVVDSIEDVPLAYEIWHVGRENFPLKGYLPFGRVTDYTIDRNTLIACPMPSEDICLEIFKKTMRGDIKSSTAESIKEFLENREI